MGRADEALVNFNTALSLNPDNTETLNNKGACLKSLGRHEDAVVCLRKCIEIRPDYAEAPYNLANILRVQRHMDEALAGFPDTICI